MRELWPFSKAVLAHWWTLMSCAVFTIAGVVLAILRLDVRWAVGVTAALAAFFLFLGCYLAWREEYLRNIGGVEIQIDWHSGEPSSFSIVEPDAIGFHNRGTEYATNIVAGAFSRSDLVWLHGIEVPSIGPGDTRVVEAIFNRQTGVGTAEVGYMKEILEESREAITIPVRYTNQRGATFSRLFTLRLVDVGRDREIVCQASEPKLVSRRPLSLD